MQTTRSISTQTQSSRCRAVGFPEDEAEQMLALIGAFEVMLPARFDHNMEAKDFGAILTALTIQAERIVAALEGQHVGHA